jgi:hypothetical protein
MDPNWAENIQAYASVATAVIALGGAWFVLRQIKQVDRGIRSNTNERLMTESLDILRFLAEHPGNYEYFYNGQEPPKEIDEVLKYATEMIANYMEHVVLQNETLPGDVQESWKTFVRDSYARSPVVREHLRKFADWYDPRLLKLVGEVQALPPSQPTK